MSGLRWNKPDVVEMVAVDSGSEVHTTPVTFP